MDTRELRIGNCVYADGRIVEVVAIDGKDNDIEVRTRQKEIFTARVDKLKIEPIPLASEQAKDCCGFDLDGMLQLGVDDLAYALKLNHDHVILMNKFGKPTIHFWEVKAIHQLQNLYYAMKGQELKVEFR